MSYEWMNDLIANRFTNAILNLKMACQVPSQLSILRAFITFKPCAVYGYIAEFVNVIKANDAHYVLCAEHQSNTVTIQTFKQFKLKYFESEFENEPPYITSRLNSIRPKSKGHSYCIGTLCLLKLKLFLWRKEFCSFYSISARSVHLVVLPRVDGCVGQAARVSNRQLRNRRTIHSRFVLIDIMFAPPECARFTPFQPDFYLLLRLLSAVLIYRRHACTV